MLPDSTSALPRTRWRGGTCIEAAPGISNSVRRDSLCAAGRSLFESAAWATMQKHLLSWCWALSGCGVGPESRPGAVSANAHDVRYPASIRTRGTALRFKLTLRGYVIEFV